MSERRTLNQADEDATRDLLVGRRVVDAEVGGFNDGSPYEDEWPTGRLTLDDGTRVLVKPNQGGCACSAGDYELAGLAKVDNIITSVRLAVEGERDEYGEGPTSYRIYVVADNVEINAVQIDGDDGNGYYGTGYELIVIPHAEEMER